MLIGPPIPEIQLFKRLTLKIHGQGHGWSRSSKSQCSMSIGSPIPEIQHFQSLSLKIQGQGHSSGSQSRYNTLSTHIPFVPCQSAFPFLGYSYFKIWHWKFKVKVISEVKVESHNVGPSFSRLTSLLFHVNRASYSWVATFSKFDPENQGPGSCVRSQFKVTMWA